MSLASLQLKSNIKSPSNSVLVFTNLRWNQVVLSEPFHWKHLPPTAGNYTDKSGKSKTKNWAKTLIRGEGTCSIAWWLFVDLSALAIPLAAQRRWWRFGYIGFFDWGQWPKYRSTGTIVCQTTQCKVTPSPFPFFCFWHYILYFSAYTVQTVCLFPVTYLSFVSSPCTSSLV